MEPEIKTAFDGLQATLKSMREKNDALELQVKKGREDVVTKLELKKVNDAVDKTRDEIDTLFKKLNRTQAINLDAKSAEIETKANLEFANWIGAEGDATKGATQRVEYKKAFDRYVRRGKDALSEAEVKTLSVGSAPDGAFYIEPARAQFIVQKLRETSLMRDIANTMTITNPSVKIPVDRDDVGFEWVGEQSARNATNTAQVGEMEIPVHELSAMPKVTQNMIDDAGIDIESWTNDKIGNRFGRAENSAFVTGNGTNKPKGFLTGTPVTTADASRAFGTLQFIGTGVSGGFPASMPSDKLLDLIYAFNAGYRPSLRWTMNRSTLGLTRKFKDGQGNYIYAPRLTDKGLVDMLFEYPVSEFSDMPDLAANSFSVALGDFKRGYLVVDRQGIRQLRDAYTDKPRVLLYTTKRVGGAVVDSDAIKLLKFI